jgi:hypothetical protein
MLSDARRDSSSVSPRALNRATVLATPANEEPLAYINWYINGYGRPWTSLDLSPRTRRNHG